MSLWSTTLRIGVDMTRKTVRKILGRHRAPPKPVLEPRGSVLDPYEAAIRAALDDMPEMLAPAVLERLRPLGYTGGVTILPDRLRRLRQRGQRPAFLTLDFPPGEAMQVDWADFGFAVPGVPRRVSAFVAVLCYSRRIYIRAPSLLARHGRDQVISERYDYRRATCITTNRPFKDWPKVFPDALNAQVIAERLTERAEHFVLEKGFRIRRP